ncbi:MAG TPA: hypothetical protein VJ063_01550, partial [Verrucomicrobiae bacterium]|nr:hypothetical protein [Verrucomicrobiae bacterium]
MLNKDAGKVCIYGNDTCTGANGDPYFFCAPGREGQLGQRTHSHTGPGLWATVASPVIIDMVALLLISVGFLLGIVALFGISKHGTKGILAPACVGLLINGLLLF